MPATNRLASRIVLALITTLVCACVVTTPTRAADGGAGVPDAVPLKELPDLVLTPWLASQGKYGNFVRPSGTQLYDGYANAGIGYAMLMEAQRTGNDEYFRSAMRAFDWINRTRHTMSGVFYQMFSASAYNFANQYFGSRSEFTRIREAWANKLRRFPYQPGVLGSYYRYNKNLVEALEVIELYNTGLRGNSTTAILKDRSLALSRALRLLDVQIPRTVDRYKMNVGSTEGWSYRTTITQMSDPPDNPPAYNALVAGLYARAYEQLPATERTQQMRDTAQMMIDGVVARVAPDGDIAFDGRSQEQAWSLSSAAYAAWNAAGFASGIKRDTLLAFSRRVIGRLETVHVSPKSSFGFLLTPAAGCCDRRDRPPGQDHYYDVGKYSGLTALTMGWAIAERPTDWLAGDATLPTDNPSDTIYRLGRGRFYQHSSGDVYWFLRMQSDYYDARADMGLALLKMRGSDGIWRDVVPPRPYTGGHHLPAAPAAPCLVYRSGCAYLELHGGTAASGGAYRFSAVWRTARRTTVRNSTVVVKPTADGLTISWPSMAGDRFRIDTFLSGGRCRSGGVARSSRATVTISGRVRCNLARGYFAGGAATALRKVSQTTTPRPGTVELTYKGRVG